MKINWQSVHQYAAHMRAAGASPMTVRLRLHYLGRAAQSLPAPDECTRQDLVDWLAGHDWAAETRRSARSALRGFFAWAVDAGHVDHDPTVKLPTVRVPNGSPRPVPTGVVTRALLESSQRDRLMLSLAAFAGMRRAEIASSQWSWVTWHGIRIVGKGGKVRQVPLLPNLSDDLAQERMRREAGDLGSGWRYRVDPYSPFIFPGLRDGHMTADAVGRILKQAMGDWSGHTLRHRFATKAYAVERDLLVVQQLLGHSKPETTARYTAVPAGAALAAIAGTAA